MIRSPLCAALVAAAVLVYPLTAHAQGVPPDAAVVTQVPQLPPLPVPTAPAPIVAPGSAQAPQAVTAIAADPVSFAVALSSAIEGQHWSVVVGLALLALALVLMAAGRKEPWLQSRARHTAIVVVVLTLSALGAALGGGAKFSIAMFLVSLAGAFVASGVAAAFLHYVTSGAPTSAFLPLAVATTLLFSASIAHAQHWATNSDRVPPPPSDSWLWDPALAYAFVLLAVVVLLARAAWRRGGRAALLLPLLLFCAPFFHGCAGASATPAGNAFTATFRSCSESAVPPLLQGLVGDATKLLLAGAGNQQLEQIGLDAGVQLGTPLVNCLVSAAVDALEAQAGAAVSAHAAIDPRIPIAITRGREFLITHGASGNVRAEKEPDTMRFALVPQTTLVAAADVAAIAEAIAIQLRRDVAPAWDREPPELTVASAPPAPARDLVVILLLDKPGATDAADDLGYHAEEGGSYLARVFAAPVLADGGGVLDGGKSGVSVASVVSHEAIEALVDVQANLWADGAALINGKPYASVALEVCDPVQGILCPVAIADGRVVQLSDWVLPAWFDRACASGPYDYAQTVKAPLTLASGGYVVARAGGSGTEASEFAEVAPPAWRQSLMRGPISRASRRGAVG